MVPLMEFLQPPDQACCDDQDGHDIEVGVAQRGVTDVLHTMAMEALHRTCIGHTQSSFGAACSVDIGVGIACGPTIICGRVGTANHQPATIKLARIADGCMAVRASLQAWLKQPWSAYQVSVLGLVVHHVRALVASTAGGLAQAQAAVGRKVQITEQLHDICQLLQTTKQVIQRPGCPLTPQAFI